VAQVRLWSVGSCYGMQSQEGGGVHVLGRVHAFVCCCLVHFGLGGTISAACMFLSAS
jgi:hypothetical protein